jgi:hypothetical protein
LVSLTLGEENRLRVFVNRALRRLFRLKREDAVRGWRRLHNEELHNLYASLNTIRALKSREMRGVRHVAGMGYEICVRSFGRKT